MRKKLLSDRTVKAVCVLTVVICVLNVINIAWSCVMLAQGNVMVEYVDEDGERTPVLVNGKEPETYLSMDQEVSIAGEIDGACRAAVSAMAVNKYLHKLLMYLLLGLVCFNGARGRMYSRVNVTLLLWCAATQMICYLLVPAVNMLLIPMLAGLSSSAEMTVRDFHFENMKFIVTCAFLLAANAVNRGRRRKKEQEAQA